MLQTFSQIWLNPGIAKTRQNIHIKPSWVIFLTQDRLKELLLASTV